MSGEGAGVILGAAVALPVIAVAGAGFVAYGAVKALYYCGKGCVSLYKKHKAKVEIQLQSTNAEIDQFYKQINYASTTIADQKIKALEAIESDFVKAQANLNIDTNTITAQNAKIVIDEINRKQEVYLGDFNQKIANLEKSSVEELGKSLSTMKAQLKTNLKLKNDIKNVIAGKADKEKAVQERVSELISQAKQELAMIKERDVHNLISREIENISNQITEVENLAKNNFGQAALSSATDVLYETINLASQLVIAEEKRWEKLVKVYNYANNLYVRLEQTQELEVVNPATNVKEAFSMSDFTRGNHDTLMHSLDDLLYSLEVAMDIRKPEAGETVTTFTDAGLEMEYDRLVNLVKPDVENTIFEGLRRIGAYCERLNCAKTIVDGLEAKSSYKQQWFACEGEDPTAPLIVKMKNAATNDEVSIKLEGGEDNAPISIQTHDFQPDDAMINEKHRANFRNLVIDSLVVNDCQTMLSCNTDTMYKNSEKNQYKDFGKIVEMELQEPTKLISQ